MVYYYKWGGKVSSQSWDWEVFFLLSLTSTGLSWIWYRIMTDNFCNMFDLGSCPWFTAERAIQNRPNRHVHLIKVYRVYAICAWFPHGICIKYRRKFSKVHLTTVGHRRFRNTQLVKIRPKFYNQRTRQLFTYAIWVWWWCWFTHSCKDTSQGQEQQPEKFSSHLGLPLAIQFREVAWKLRHVARAWEHTFLACLSVRWFLFRRENHHPT